MSIKNLGGNEMKKIITRFIALTMSVMILFMIPAFAVNYGDELKNSPNHTYTVILTPWWWIRFWRP